MILKHVWTCSGSIRYELLWFIWFLNMSELVHKKMIRIDAILKHVRTWNQNMMKYSNIWANGTKNVWRQSDSLDRWEQVERSKIESSEKSERCHFFYKKRPIFFYGAKFIFRSFVTFLGLTIFLIRCQTKVLFYWLQVSLQTIVDVALPLKTRNSTCCHTQPPIPKGWSYGCHSHPNMRVFEQLY